MRDFSQNHSALALNTATLGHNLDGYGQGWSPEQIVDACAERGYGGITFWRREFAGMSINQAATIGERVRQAGLRVSGLCRTPFLVGSERPQPHQSWLGQCEASIELAAALQADTLTIVVGGIEPGTQGIADSLNVLTDRLAELLHLAQRHNVRLGLEPLHPVYAGNRSCLVSMRDTVDIIKQLDHPLLGAAVDVYHVWWDTTLIAELKRLEAHQIHGYHLCDWLENTTDVLLDRGMMGDGVADLKTIRHAVESAGYTGLCEVEIFSRDNWWKRSPDDVLDEIVRRFQLYC